MNLADLTDSVLETLVVPSFTRVGPLVRSRLEHWGVAAGNDLSGRVFVITGATSGLGLVAARAWLAAGATVEILARNPAKANAALAQLRRDVPGGTVNVVGAEMGDVDQIRRAAVTIRDRHEVVDAVIHNAGALEVHYAAAPGGIERTLASQVVGPFLLSSLLFEPLVAAAPGRIIWVSSGGMYSEGLSVGSLDMGPENYRGTIAYARAKRAQVTLSEMMATRVPASQVVVHAMHPGWALTPGVERSLPTFRRVVGPLLRTGDEGADTLIWLAANDGDARTSTGKFWLDRRVRPIHRRAVTRQSDTPEERDRLWEWTTNAAGVDFPPTSR